MIIIQRPAPAVYTYGEQGMYSAVCRNRKKGIVMFYTVLKIKEAHSWKLQTVLKQYWNH
jgi:hypothetical protein